MTLIRINHRPSPRQLLVFALAWLVFTGLLGLAQWVQGRPAAAIACWLASAIVPMVGAAWPEGLRRLYLGLAYATYPVGLAVSSLVLVTLYYAVLTPIGLILRLCRYDPLHRRFDRQAASYWHQRPARREPADYFRQH
jgi:hypothetical protein